MKQREQWKSEWGFLMAAVGSAVGLGNIWRFSYIAYTYGGGAFLIPYFTALLTAGIPLLILEFGIGHERIGSAPLAYHKLHPSWEWLGWWAVIFVMFGIELYYTVVIAWCVNYFTLAFDLGWGADPNAYFFKTFLAMSDSPAEIGSVRTPILASLAVVWFLNWLIIYRGVRRGLELANKVFMPLLLALTLVLIARAVTLDGASLGIRAYLTPDFSKLGDPKVWIAAYGQIFFTMSLGFGIMIAYASYLPAKANITRSAIATALCNSGYELLAGFAVFSVLGFMATAQGVGIQDVVAQSIGLAFVAYPKALSLMPGGKLFGAVFFLCLVVAGISSSISILEAFTSAVVDKFGADRRKVVTITSVVGFLGSIVFATQAGLLWLDIVDHFLNQYGLVMVGLFECVLAGWLFRIAVLRNHINKVSSIKLGRLWTGLVRFFIPLVLGVILAVNLIGEVKEPYGGYGWAAVIAIGFGWVLLTILAAFVFASKPWLTSHPQSPNRSESPTHLR